MRFWDTSAIIPLVVTEPGSTVVRTILREDSDMAVWWNAEVECIAALSDVFRRKHLDQADVNRALERLEWLLSAWSEVAPTDEVRVRAERLLFDHDLRAADALHLGAALLWAEDGAHGAELVSLDHRQRIAAKKEGFALRPTRWATKKGVS